MRRTRSIGALAPLALLGAGGLAGYHLVGKPWHMRWGASDEELARPMPGDELVERPVYVSNRAITLHARPEAIWPWLAQLGMGRGGFYSYAWFERLTGLSTTTVEHLLPEFQDLEAGEFIPAGRGLHLPVRAVEPFASLVIGERPEAPAGGAQVSWSLGLYPADGVTRLVSRVRSSYRWRPGNPLFAFLLGPIHFALERKMLLGIKRRAESFAARREQGAGLTPPPARAPLP